MDDEGWEARMAARAKARREAAEAEARAKLEAEIALLRTRIGEAGDPYGWLNGWSRLGESTSVLIGTGVYCIGCGRDKGVTTVAFPEGWAPPGPEPRWPFAQGDCRVCELTKTLYELSWYAA